MQFLESSLASAADQATMCALTQSPPAVEDQAAEQVMPPCGALTAKRGQLPGIILKWGDKMERRAKVGEEAWGG